MDRDRARTYLLLRTVLHALRDFLPTVEAADLGAQLPLLIKGIYFDGWNPARSPVAHRSRADFVGRVTEMFSKEPLEDPEFAIRQTLALLARHVSEGEIDHVKHTMRTSLQDLWSEP